MANINRWIGSRGVYRNLRERADTAEQWHAVTLAAWALDQALDDHEHDTQKDVREVDAEMKIRVSTALHYVDWIDEHGYQTTNDNGVGDEVITAPMPASVEEELPY